MGTCPIRWVKYTSVIYFRLEASYKGRFLHHIEPTQFVDSVECDTLLRDPSEQNAARENFYQVLVTQIIQYIKSYQQTLIIIWLDLDMNGTFDLYWSMQA